MKTRTITYIKFKGVTAIINARGMLGDSTSSVEIAKKPGLRAYLEHPFVMFEYEGHEPQAFPLGSIESVRFAK